MPGERNPYVPADLKICLFVGPTIAASVRCGGQKCNAAKPVCCVQPKGGARCTTAKECHGEKSPYPDAWQCMSSADCSGGWVCCGQNPSGLFPGTPRTGCAADCQWGEGVFQACANDEECGELVFPAGTKSVCEPSGRENTPPGVKTCSGRT